MSTLIKRNTTVPCKKSSIFTTTEDGQRVVTIHVYEGQSIIFFFHPFFLIY
jgi:molecular chaperone DnaK (HSP70)